MNTAIDDDRPPSTLVHEPNVAPRARGRVLWVLFGSLLVIAGLGWGVVNVVELLAHEERTEHITVPAADISRLFVDSDTGSVTIVGTDADDITIEAEVSEGLRSTGFRHEVVDSTLELHGSCPTFGSMWCRVTYRIETPRGVDVEVSSDNGRVEISNIDGDVRINADNGSAELADLSGAVAVDGDNGSVVGSGLSSAVADVETDNGRIELSFSAPPDRVNANGDNGSIEVVLPAVDSGYDVEADTPNGGETINVLDNPESPHAVRLQTDNGSITVLTDG